jgi:hypothetical protein
MTAAQASRHGGSRLSHRPPVNTMKPVNRHVPRHEHAPRQRERARRLAWCGLNGVALASAILATSFLGCGPRDEVLIGAGLTSSDAGAGGSAGVENATGTLGVAGEPRVIDLVLVDATTGLDLRMLNAGDTIDVTSMPVTIRAVVEPLPGSILFKVDDKAFHTENAPPWTINGSDPVTGKLIPWTAASGDIRIDAEPYLESDANGGRGRELNQNFVIE